MSVRYPDRLLRAEPTKLRAAIAKLGHGTADPRVARDVVEAVTRKMEGQVPDHLDRQELRALPHVLAAREDLGPPIAKAATRFLGRLRSYTLRSLLLYLPKSPAFVSAATRRIASAPPRHGPAWLRAIEPTSDLTLLLTRHVMSRRQPLRWVFDAAGLELDVASPLGHQVAMTLVTTSDRRWVEAQLDEFLTLTAQSSLDPALRQACLVRLMDPCTGRVQSPEDPFDDVAVRWLEAAQAWAQGWPNEAPGPWSRLPARAAELARWFIFSRDLREFFGSTEGNADRIAYWRAWIHQVRDHATFKRVGAFAIRLADYWIVEFLQVGNATYIYTHERWSQLRVSPEVSDINRLKMRRVATTRLIHRGPWAMDFDRSLASLGLRR